MSCKPNTFELRFKSATNKNEKLYDFDTLFVFKFVISCGVFRNIDLKAIYHINQMPLLINELLLLCGTYYLRNAYGNNKKNNYENVI